MAALAALWLAAAVWLWWPQTPLAPNLTLPLLNGGSVRVGRGQSQPVLLVFWSVTCEPCLQQIPEVIRAARRLAPEHVTVVAVDVSSDPLTVVRDFARHTLPYAVALDPGGVALAGFHVTMIPRTILVAPGGRIAYDQGGGFRVSALRDRVLQWTHRQTGR